MLQQTHPSYISTVAGSQDSLTGTPWEEIGHPIPRGASVEETLKAAGLDWNVLKRQAFVDTVSNDTFNPELELPVEPMKVPGNYVLLREDTMNPIGPFVGSRYKPIQNVDAFEVFREFCEAGNMTMETAGSLYGGQHIWGLARIEGDYELCNGEIITGYFLLMQSHVYGSALKALFTPVRYPGGHMMVQAVNKSAKIKRAYTMSHSRVFNETRIEEIKEVMGVAKAVLADYVENARSMIDTQVTEAEAVMFFIEQFHKDLFTKIKKGLVENVPTKLADLDNWEESNLNLRRVTQYMDEYAGSGLPTCKGTAWGLLQAVNHAYDHSIGRTTETRMEAVWMGTTATKKLGALQSAMKIKS